MMAPKLRTKLDMTIDPKYVERYKSINVETLGDLFLTTERDIRRTRRIPAKGLYQAKKAMEVHGFILKEK